MPRLGISVGAVRRLLLALPGVTLGRSYGYPAYVLERKFLARFRDDDTVLVVQLASIEDREVLMRLAPEAFFFTDHYRDHPGVLVRLAKVDPALLAQVLTDAHQHVAAMVKRAPRRARPRRPPTRN